MQTMDKNVSFVAITEQYLISKINKAKTRVAFIGAGFSSNVADAVVKKMNLVENIIFDNNSDVYRIGYGYAESLKILRDAGIQMQEAHNIRINVFVTDDEALIYSPNPFIVEDPVKENFPNGIVINYSAVAGLFNVVETSSKQFAKEKGLTENQLDTQKLVVTALTDKSISKTLQIIKENPPKLDLHRKLNAYNARIKFIEIQLSGFNIKQHKVKIPSDLLLVAKDDENVQKQLSATYNLFNTFDKESNLVKRTTNIQDSVKRLREKYTLNLTGYGAMCLVSKIPEIEREIQEIQNEIELTKKDLARKIKLEIDSSKKALSKALVPVVQNNPPQVLRYNLFDSKKITVKAARIFVDDQLDKAFITGNSYLDDMKLEVRYKDLTLNTLEKPEVVSKIMNSKWKYNFIDDGILTYEKGLAEVTE